MQVSGSHRLESNYLPANCTSPGGTACVQHSWQHEILCEHIRWDAKGVAAHA